MSLRSCEGEARYYSDDFAVIDEQGLFVHAFPKPLSIRDDDQVQNDYSVERLGGTAGEDPVPIGAVVFTEYRSGAAWRPTLISHGRGVLGMLEHTLPARRRAGEALRVFNGAIRGAVLLRENVERPLRSSGRCSRSLKKVARSPRLGTLIRKTG